MTSARVAESPDGHGSARVPRCGPDGSDRPRRTSGRETVRPLYARALRLRHVDPGGVLCFVFFEGALILATLLALAELVSWWGILALPASVAVMVKVNDLVAAGVARSAARVPVHEQERFRRELAPAVGRAAVPPASRAVGDVVLAPIDTTDPRLRRPGSPATASIAGRFTADGVDGWAGGVDPGPGPAEPTGSHDDLHRGRSVAARSGLDRVRGTVARRVIRSLSGRTRSGSAREPVALRPVVDPDHHAGRDGGYRLRGGRPQNVSNRWGPRSGRQWPGPPDEATSRQQQVRQTARRRYGNGDPGR